MSQIIIASTNPHKISKLKEILEPYFDNTKSLVDLTGIKPIEENGTTFAENARLKAISLSKQLETIVIATDAGANIPALSNTWNALYTRRFVGENKTDEDRVRMLLELMSGKIDRRVWFTEAYSLCENGAVLFETEVNSPIGHLKDTWDGRMKPGAWLLSLWHLPNKNKDFFDLTPEEIREEENTWATLKKNLDEFLSNAKL